MFWFKKKEIYTDGEIDVVKIMELSGDRGNHYIPSILYEIRLHGKKTSLGRCDLRLGMDEELYYAGQIGYTVYPRHRGHRYAYKACRILFQLAKEKYLMEDLIITCNPDNLPSRRTLERLNGQLKEIVNVPKSHDLYRQGDRQKCIFVYHLN